MTEISEREKIFNWLTPSDYSVQQSRYIKMHEKGTGQWLLDSAEFKTWIETERQLLFCPGIPGAGKTIITALVVQNLSSRFAHDPKVGVAYTYFNFWQQEEHWIEDLFAALLTQLSEGLSSLPASLKALYDDHKGERGRPSFEKVFEVLQSIIGISYERVFIVVDALDECQESNNCRMRFIEGLFILQQWGANIMATSRPITDVTDKFEKSTWLEIRASDDDIRTYVDAQISYGRSKILLEMRAEASIGIAKAADGMYVLFNWADLHQLINLLSRFLLAKLDLDSLLDAKLPKEVKERLNNLPKGSQAYSDAYQGIMKRVEHQGPKSVKFAKSVLSWVTCAKRPLIMLELQHALAVEIGSHAFNEEYLPQAQDLISVCAGLVTVDEDSNTIRLFHYTAQEYFEQTQNQWFPDVKNDITNVCITYLSFDIFETGFSSTDTAFEERLKSYQLYDYAAHNWGHHARESSTLGQLILDFLMKEAKIEAMSQALFIVKESREPGYSQDIPLNTSGLHLAAYFGIEKAVAALLNSNDPDLKDSHNRTPLSWAAENGHEAALRLLLDKGANSKAKDQSNLTPLSWAAMRGHQTIVRLLDIHSLSQLDDIADAAKRKLQRFNLMRESVQMIKEGRQNDKERKRLSQKSEAINFGLNEIKVRREEINNELIRLQMEKEKLMEEENCQTREIAGLSQMQADAEGKQEQLSKQWIYAQTNLYELRQMDGCKDEYALGKTRDLVLFRWAVEDGYAKIVELLLCGGTDATITNEDGWLPLHAAANKGRVDIVGLLIDTGKVRVDSEDNNGQTALQVAAKKGHRDVVHLLLKKGAVMSHCQYAFEGHTGSVVSVVFSHDSKLVASGSWDCTVRLWDAATGKCRRTLEGHNRRVYAVTFSHDSMLIASGALDDTVKLWDTATGKCQRTFKGHSRTVCSVAFAHDSKLVASGSWDWTVKLWDAATGNCWRTLKGHSNWVCSVAFSHNSKLIASGSMDNTIKLWDTATGKCLQTLKGHSSTVASVVFSYNSRLIASRSVDNTIKLWNTTTGKCHQTLEGHSNDIDSVVFSYNSNLIALKSDEETIDLWDIATGKCRQTLKGYGSKVYSVAFSHNLKLIVSGSTDDIIKLWDIATGI